MFKTTACKLDISKLKKTAVMFALADGKLAPKTDEYDKANHKVISKAIKSSRFTGSKSEVFYLPTPQITGLDLIVLVGLGKAKALDERTWRRVAVDAAKAVDNKGSDEATVVIEDIKEDETKQVVIAEAVVEGFAHGMYRFDCYKTGLKDHQKAKFKKLNVMIKDDKAFAKRISAVEAQNEGCYLARDLVNLPPNVAGPDYMAVEANKLKKLGVKVKVLGEKEMTKLGMNLLLAVGQGCNQESRLIVMKYNGDKKSKDYKAIVGKGVMFDTGGYNLKPAAGMGAMKSDMAGAAAVMGAMRALAERKSKVNVVGVVGCVINMVDSDAFLPSDILKAYNGKTVEIGNTDAEGRLVLADALAYTIDTEKPTEIIDIATLTGACMVALGGHYAGLFTPDGDMAKKLKMAGQSAGERLWRLPLDAGYAAKPKLADLNNDGSRFGGSSTAAVFLKNFVGKTPWAHLDIAGVGMADKVPGVQPVVGASGFGVRLFVKYLES